MAEYKLVREIGRGGMGSVWYGVRSDGAECAIKCMLAKFVSIPDYREFFDSEAQAMKGLDHPSVVKIMGDTFTDAKGNLYLPMEYVEGETIEQRIKRSGLPLSEQEAIAVMSDVLDAFAYIHGQGQIHRDIKPSNIMLRPDGRVCIIDFGIAKDMKTSTGKTVGRQVGTSGYMSPEQISALNIDHRTDIYSLGCLLFYMLTAQHAITKRTNDYETMYAIQRGDFPSVRAFNPNVSQRLEEIIYKATDKDMRRRYQSAEAFKQALLQEDAIGDEPHVSTTADLHDLEELTGHWSLSVGRSGQDITMPNAYVSSHHLDIELDAGYITEGRYKVHRNLTLTDHSTNGTGVDGKYVHNKTEYLSVDILKDSIQSMPDVLLAGREECRLDWNLVYNALVEKMARDINHNAGREQEIHDGKGSKDGDTVKTNNTYFGIILVSFLFPIVGWVLYANIKNHNKIKARKAFAASWWGFGFGIVINTLILLLQ